MAISDLPDLKLSSARGRWVIAVVVLGSGMAFLDSTVVNVALPSIRNDFHAGISGMEWVVDAYLLTLGSLIVFAGSLGDLYGRRTVFLGGAAAFTLASLICGVAPNEVLLIVARGVQGVAGALLVPQSLAIISSCFSAQDRGKAIGSWSGATTAIIAVGPVLGGALIHISSWRLVFLINLPLGAITIFLGMRHLPETRNDRTNRPDIAGAVLLSLALLGLVEPLIQSPVHGWNPLQVSAVVAGIIFLVAFVAVERRVKAPMVPLDIFRSRQFSATNTVTLAVYACLGFSTFVTVTFLQDEMHFSPVDAGFAFVPSTLLLIVMSGPMGGATARIGARLPMTIGPLFIAAGLVALSRLTSASTYFPDVFVGAMLFGIGLGTTVAPLTTTVLGSAPRRHAGVASAINNAVARIASLLAVAVLPAVTGLAAASGPNDSRYLSGFHSSMLLAAGLAVVGALLALTFVSGKPAPNAAESAS